MTALEATLKAELEGDDTPESRKALVAWYLEGDDKSSNYYYKDVTFGQLPSVRHPFSCYLDLHIILGYFSVLPHLRHFCRPLHIYFKHPPQ